MKGQRRGRGPSKEMNTLDYNNTFFSRSMNITPEFFFFFSFPTYGAAVILMLVTRHPSIV